MVTSVRILQKRRGGSREELGLDYIQENRLGLWPFHHGGDWDNALCAARS